MNEICFDHALLRLSSNLRMICLPLLGWLKVAVAAAVVGTVATDCWWVRQIAAIVFHDRNRRTLDRICAVFLLVRISFNNYYHLLNLKYYFILCFSGRRLAAVFAWQVVAEIIVFPRDFRLSFRPAPAFGCPAAQPANPHCCYPGLPASLDNWAHYSIGVIRFIMIYCI